MANYDHLKALQVTSEKTSKFVLHQITVNNVSPTLIVSPATDANKPYFNALLKRAGKSARAIKAGAISSGMIEDNREEDKELFAKHVVKDWKNQIDGTGEEIPFSVSECADFLAVLPDWLFDDLRAYCVDPQNFTEVVDVQVKAKN